MATTVTPGTGAGSGASATLLAGSDDGQGTVRIVGGIGGTPGGTLFSLGFNEPYDVEMSVSVFPANGEAAVAIASVIPATKSAVTGFDLVTTLIAATKAGATYDYFYRVEP